MAELPCDSDGMCMVCKTIPTDAQVLLCNSCSSPWHMGCLKPPMTSVPVGDWFCPDCEPSSLPAEQQAATPSATVSTPSDDVVSQIRAIRSDPNLTEEEKARKCQDVMSNKGKGVVNEGTGASGPKKHKMLEMFDETLNCIFCMQLADRPVTTPCGHNFCLKCFQRWIGQGKKACGKCRAPIPAKMASQPRINSALVVAIRMAKSAVNPCSSGPPKPYHYIQNQDRPDKCFTTERAKKAGKANAASGKIFVTVPPDHFGPITAENDPVRGQGVLVGETWEDRMECRQWGAHLPHVAGIAGQSECGAQSVALSGGYEDDEDHGEWFLYTGSGGRDLSGNKRTNDKQSFDQTFDKSNLALRVSCKRGYPVRVVRSHKEKRSSYAPENGVRYDGIYRIEKCWRKIGVQGYRVCRYLFVRCDNEPAPWTSDERGDMPRPLPKISELKSATDMTERKSEPAWDWKEDVWCWTKEPPTSRKIEDGGNGQRHGSRKSLSKSSSIGQRLLKEFGCGLCKKVLKLPLSTPCGHNFCKSCLVAAFAGQADIRERIGVGGRSLRTQKIVKRCPSCRGDISDLLINPQVNHQMEDIIQSLKNNAEADSDAEINDGAEEEDSREENCSKGSSVPVAIEESLHPRSNGNKEIAADLSTPSFNPDNKDDKSGVACYADINGNSHPTGDLTKEKQFLDICKRYPEYSEELLRSMLVDQEGDVLELNSVLKALRKQQKANLKKQGECVSPPSGRNCNPEDRNNAEAKDDEPGKDRMAQPSQHVTAKDASRSESNARGNRRKRKDQESKTDEVQEPVSKRSCQGRTSKSVSPSSPLQVHSDSDFE